MNIGFVPSVCTHRRIILIFIEKVCLSIISLKEYFFPAIFDFHFRENPRFRDEFQALSRSLHQMVYNTITHSNQIIEIISSRGGVEVLFCFDFGEGGGMGRGEKMKPESLQGICRMPN